MDYAYGVGKEHNENEMRNQLITGVNLVDGVSYLEQMQMYWNKAREGYETQVLRIVQSFSRKLLDSDNPDIVATEVVTNNAKPRVFANVSSEMLRMALDSFN